jgi:hypothetical protein
MTVLMRADAWWRSGCSWRMTAIEIGGLSGVDARALHSQFHRGASYWGLISGNRGAPPPASICACRFNAGSGTTTSGRSWVYFQK